MKIIYIAFGCSTLEGGEVKIGWSIPYEMSKYNEVIVITRTIYKDEHEKNKTLLEGHNLRFIYTDVNPIFSKYFKGQLLPILLKGWNNSALKIAKEICNTEEIDIIHQITPIEIRSIGHFEDIQGPKFVVGPLGGGEYMPKSLEEYIPSLKIRLFEIGRRLANRLARMKLIRRGRKIDCALFANKETFDYLEKVEFPYKRIMSDIGVDSPKLNTNKEKRVGSVLFLIAGRLAYRKGHLLLLDSISQIEDKSMIKFVIVGDGPMKDILVNKCNELGLDKLISFEGNVKYTKMKDYYDKADVFIMPSLRETGGTVLLEALSNGIPVIAPNAFGGKYILDGHTGYLYNVKNESKQSIIDGLKNSIIQAKADVLSGKKMEDVCVKKVSNYTWEVKCKEYYSVYKTIVNTSKCCRRDYGGRKNDF